MRRSGAHVVAAMCLLLGLISLVVGSDAIAALPKGPVDILSYRTDLKILFEARAVEGATTIRLRARSGDVDKVSLSANALTIESATVDGRPASIVRDNDALIVALPNTLRAGRSAVIRVAFHGRPERGLVFTARTIASNYFTCDWMICALEDIGEKARFELDLHVPVGMTAVGPGRLISRTRLRDGDERQVWRQDRGYSAYLHGFALGHFSRATDRVDRTELVYLSADADPERLHRLFAPTGEMLRFLEAKAGVPFPHRTYVQIHMPGSEAQEAESFALIGERMIAPSLDNPQEDWVIVHELAHQWWGNLVTCNDLSQFWLNEGIASFMVAAWKEHRWGRAEYDSELTLMERRVAEAKRQGVDYPLTYPNAYPSLSLRRAIQYSKGALFMDRLRREVGEGAFWRGLKDFTQANAGGVVDSRDLQSAFERASGRGLQALFDAWVYWKPARA